jgi:hypothetical protein
MRVPGRRGNADEENRSRSDAATDSGDTELKIALINAKTSLRNTRWTALGGFAAAAVAAGVSLYLGIYNKSSSPTTSTSETRLALGPIRHPTDGSSIGVRVNLSGQVSGLKPGDLIWTFNEPYLRRRGVPSDRFYPDTGLVRLTATHGVVRTSRSAVKATRAWAGIVFGLP